MEKVCDKSNHLETMGWKKMDVKIEEIESEIGK
jgi:hypothetical protein